jgi:hypothetical protein
MLQINVHDETIKLSDLIRAANNNEGILIITDDQKKFIVQVKSVYPRPQYGSAEGLFEMADDFDAPLEDFKDYMP